MNTTPNGQSVGFLHVPKCAGTSILRALMDVFDADSICPIRHDQELPKGLQVYSGHFAAHRLQTLEIDFIFTVLRDPYERLVSAYRFLKAHNASFAQENDLTLASHAKTLSFDLFCQHEDVLLHPFFYNPYVNMLTQETMPTRWERSINESGGSSGLISNSVSHALDIIDKMQIQVFNLFELPDLEKKLHTLSGKTVSIGQKNVTDHRHIDDKRFELIEAVSDLMPDGRSRRQAPHILNLISGDVALLNALKDST